MESIRINSSLYDYDVFFVDNIKDSLEDLSENQCAYVIDKNVYELYSDSFISISRECMFLIDAVESKKNIDTILELISFWQKIKLRKNWKVICIGGGITQDITTFASNIYLRNVEWYFFPTTLLSMSDSCIGGKCGINLGEYKNQLGVFYPPKRIYICDRFLSTISKEDYINGWGEILKFSLTEESSFYYKVEKEKEFIPCPTICEYIKRGLEVKKHIIEKDEFEGDLRRVLNYGHTFGHALEAYTHNKIPHGTAVIWGIDVVNYISMQKKMISMEDYFRIKNMISEHFITDEIVVSDSKRFMQILSTDKKIKNSTVYLILLEQISKLAIVPFDLTGEINTLFEAYLEENHAYYCN